MADQTPNNSQEQSEKIKDQKVQASILDVLTVIKKDLKSGAEGKGADATKTIRKTAETVKDAVIDEVPGLGFLSGVVGDTKNYITGLKKRAAEEAEAKAKAEEAKAKAKAEEAKAKEQNQDSIRHNPKQVGSVPMVDTSTNEESETVPLIKETNNKLDVLVSVQEGQTKEVKPKEGQTKEVRESNLSDSIRHNPNQVDTIPTVDTSTNKESETVPLIKETNNKLDVLISGQERQIKLAEEEKRRAELEAAKDKQRLPVQSSIVPKDQKEKPKSLLDLLKDKIGGILSGIGGLIGALLGSLGSLLFKSLPGMLLKGLRLLNPIALIGTVFGTALTYFSEDITKFFTGGGMEEAIKDVVPKLNEIGKAISATFSKIKENVMALWDDFSIGGAIDLIGSGLSGAFGLAKDGVTGLLSMFGIETDKVGAALSSSFEGLAKGVFYTIGGIAGYTVDDMHKFWEDEFKPMIGDKLLGIVNWFSNISDSISNFFGSIKDGWDNFSAESILKDAANGITGFFGKMLTGFQEWLASGIKDIPLVGKTIYKFLTGRDTDVDAEYEKLNARVASGELKADSAEYQAELARIAKMQDEANKPLLQKGEEYLTEKKDQAVGAVKSVGSKVADWGSNLWNDVKSGAGHVAQKMSGGSGAGHVAQKMSGGSDKTSLSEVMASGGTDIFLKSKTASDKGIPNTLPKGKEGEEVQSNLQRLKDTIVAPISKAIPGVQMSSAFRSEELNTKLGGAKASDHKEGRAIDLSLPNSTPAQLADGIIRAGIPYDKLIVEPSWVHLSMAKSGETPKGMLMNAQKDTRGSMKYSNTTISDIQKNAGLSGGQIGLSASTPAETPSVGMTGEQIGASTPTPTPTLAETMTPLPGPESAIPQETAQLNTQANIATAPVVQPSSTSNVIAPSTSTKVTNVAISRTDAKVYR